VDELFASCIKLAYQTEYSFLFEYFDEIEASKLQRICVNYPSCDFCDNWAKYQKRVSILLLDKMLKEITLLVILLTRTLNPFVQVRRRGSFFHRSNNADVSWRHTDVAS
jgi:hypothetical protein